MNPRIKKSIICKHIDINEFVINEDKTNYYVPQVGDVALFEIVSIGKHKQIQSDDKRNMLILPGDVIMAAFGTRYATAQFEGYVPTDCRDTFHILGAGGTIGIIESMNAAYERVGPTIIKIIGYLTQKDGTVANTLKLSSQLHPFKGTSGEGSNIVLSIGSSMDSGKTTTAAYMARGLKCQGYKVAFIKLTGTVYTKDRDLVYDCGADITADFSDFGFPSTYMCSQKQLLDLFESLVRQVARINPDYIIMEIADGILQRETKMLLRSRRFMSLIEHVVFSSCDSLSALHGIGMLESLDIYPTAISGLLTTSPLLIKEVEAHTNVPVLTLKDWTEVDFASFFSRSKLKHA